MDGGLRLKEVNPGGCTGEASCGMCDFESASPSADDLFGGERYRFEVIAPDPHRVLIQIIFFPSRKVAEVLTSDAKPLLLAGVSTPTKARRKWFELRHGTGYRTIESRMAAPRPPSR